MARHTMHQALFIGLHLRNPHSWAALRHFWRQRTPIGLILGLNTTTVYQDLRPHLLPRPLQKPKAASQAHHPASHWQQEIYHSKQGMRKIAAIKSFSLHTTKS